MIHTLLHFVAHLIEYNFKFAYILNYHQSSEAYEYSF